MIELLKEIKKYRYNVKKAQLRFASDMHIENIIKNLRKENYDLDPKRNYYINNDIEDWIFLINENNEIILNSRIYIEIINYYDITEFFCMKTFLFYIMKYINHNVKKRLLVTEFQNYGRWIEAHKNMVNQL